MFKIKRYLTIVFAVCLLAIAVSAGADINADPDGLKAIKGKFSFVVLGDNRSGDEVYSRLIKLAMSKRPDFMVNTGDQIRHAGNFDEWAKFQRLSAPVTVPYFLVAGNHDVDDVVSEETYRHELRLPVKDLYYSFVAGNSLFVVLDSCVPDEEEQITGKQYEWLRDLLSRSKETHKFVFLHHPMYPEKGVGNHYGHSLDRYEAARDRLEALFEREHVTMVFAGHEHLYLRKSVGDITHIITGGGGAPLYTNDWKGGFYHFVRVTVDGDNINCDVVDLDGKVRDSFRPGKDERASAAHVAGNPLEGILP